MRIAIALSTVSHISVLVWGYVAFPDAHHFEVAIVESVPVELVPISELTRLAKGAPTAKPKDEPSTADPLKALITRPQAPTPPKVEDQPPEPLKIEPLKIEPPKIAPPKVASVEPEPTPTVETPEPPAVSKKPTPVPPRRPRRREKVVRTARRFESDKITALLDKQKSVPIPDESQKTASLGTQNGRPVNQMSQSELDALQGQIERCWNPPLGAIDADSLTVRLKFVLTRDGRVEGRPEVINSSTSPFFRAAADSARRAVQRCQPYQMPAEKYDTWRDVILNFDPRKMLGG
jgi:outer membrane biosynthesis protein TonB